MKLDEMRNFCIEIIMAGVSAADPYRLVEKNIQVDGNEIKICDRTFDRDEFEEIVVLGIGKASTAMASGCKKLDPDDGLIITKKGYGFDNLNPIEVRIADHPYPEKNSLLAASDLLSKVEKKKDSLFVFLISGGGSSLFSLPVEGVSIEDLNKLNRLLVNSGATIHEINTVRKHISRVKGGKFGKFCSKHGKVISLILSDVVGDNLSDIASGPTYQDNTTYQDTKTVLEEYDLWEKIPESVRKHIMKGLEGVIEDTPSEVDTDNYLIGNNLLALRKARNIAEKKGFDAMILTSQNTGEAKESAKPLTGIAKEIQDSYNPIRPPAALVIGGETTVAMNDINIVERKGGPNRELILSAALEIKEREKIVVASVDTDGTDGRGKAGAMADTASVHRSELDANELLNGHDSQRFFDELGDSIELNSRTNVNDITVILIDET
ncbi:MAG: glycerate kinase type-2 family protein [Candidatus Saliniplasma sp.]